MNLTPFIDEIVGDVISELGSRLSPQRAEALNESDMTAIQAALEKAAGRGLIRGAIETHVATTALAAELFNCPELVPGFNVDDVEIPDIWAEEYGGGDD